MKRISISIAAIIFALGISACGNTATNKEHNENDSISTETVQPESESHKKIETEEDQHIYKGENFTLMLPDAWIGEYVVETMTYGDNNENTVIKFYDKVNREVDNSGHIGELISINILDGYVEEETGTAPSMYHYYGCHNGYTYTGNSVLSMEYVNTAEAQESFNARFKCIGDVLDSFKYTGEEKEASFEDQEQCTDSDRSAEDILYMVEAFLEERLPEDDDGRYSGGFVLEETDSYVKLSVFYRISEERYNEIVSNGGMPSISRPAPNITVDRETGEVFEEVLAGEEKSIGYLW